MGQKFIKYSIMMSGISLLFYFGGLVATNPLLDLLLDPNNMSTSSFYVGIISAFTAVAGIFVGFITRDFDKGLMIVILPVILSLLWNFVAVGIILYSQVSWFAVLILAPFYLAFIITGIDYYRGND